MIYEHVCECGHAFEVVKKIEARDTPEYCSVCGNAEVPRKKVPSSIQIAALSAAEWNSQTYNPALGGVFRDSQAKKEAKRRGLTEIGNEPVDKIHKDFDNERKKKADYDISEITNLGAVNSK